MASATTEVLVLGGGPAGSSAARLLASWGHDVQLITRPPAEHRLAVSLPPSCAKLFRAIGVADAVDGASFIRSTGNTVWWGGGDARVELFADGARGWQVDLGRFSDVLLGEAARAGARVERRLLAEAECRRGALDPPAAFVIDATGRSGVLARAKDLRQYDDGPRTIALAAEWTTGPAWSIPDDTHTVIESYEDGWIWSVPAAAGVRHVAAMVDPQRSDLARGGSPRDVYLAEIRKAREFSRLLGGGSLRGGPWGWDASTYRARAYAGDGWLLTGDAGSFIDPLSSAGVKKALASGWLAAIVAHTCLANPPMRSHALAFFDAREREIERHHLAASRHFLGDAARGHRHAFWADRSDEPEPPPFDPEDARRALDRLKAAAAVRIRASAAVTIEPRPFILGNEILLGPHIVTADLPAGIRHLHDVDLVAVLELARAVTQVPDLFEAYVRRAGPVALHDFLLALSTAVARGILVSE